MTDKDFPSWRPSEAALERAACVVAFCIVGGIAVVAFAGGLAVGSMLTSAAGWL